MPNALNLEGIALTPGQGKWRRVADELGRDVLGPAAAQVDLDGVFPEANVKELKSSGLLGLTLASEWGGAGESIVTAAVVTETLAKYCASTAMIYAMHQSAVPLINSLCDDEQGELFLGPIGAGTRLGAFAMSEPGSGTRIWHMDSYAEPDGEGFLIDSFKSFATSAGHCDFYVVPVRADATVGPTDLSIFVIDAADPNIEPKGTWDGMGLRGNSSRPVHFNGCRVPAVNRLGEPTAGFSFMMAYSLPIYLVGLSACYLGIAQAALDTATQHVLRRVHTDTQRSLASVETVQRYFAEMKIKLDAARATVLRVAQMSDKNATVLFDEFAEAELLDEIIRENPDDPYFVELAELKVVASEAATQVANIALQVCGGAGYKRGHAAERLYRDARAGSLMAPSDDVLKVIMGNQLLGNPQPWA